MKIFHPMYALTVSVVFSAACLAAPDEVDHSAHHPGAEVANTAEPDAGASTEGQTTEHAAGAAGGEEQRSMMDMMASMQDMMQEIHDAKTPEEKQKLMGEHMQMMQRGMGMMMGMNGMDAMEQRMDMMQGMMQQMLQHQAAEQDAE